MNDDIQGTHSRRDFLHKLGVGAAGAAAATTLTGNATIASARNIAPLVLRTTQKTLRVAVGGTLSPQFKSIFDSFKKSNYPAARLGRGG